MPRFTRASNESLDPHRFEVFDCTAAGGALVAELSDDVRALYLDADFDRLLEQAAAASTP